jgi:hypothetical protein
MPKIADLATHLAVRPSDKSARPDRRRLDIEDKQELEGTPTKCTGAQ